MLNVAAVTLFYFIFLPCPAFYQTARESLARSRFPYPVLCLNTQCLVYSMQSNNIENKRQSAQPSSFFTSQCLLCARNPSNNVFFYIFFAQ